MNNIRKLILMQALTVVLLCGCSQYKVYSVKDNPMLPVNGGVLYALPVTQIRVAVTVERRDLELAPYSKYASKYIGAENIDTAYRIVSIDVEPVNVADPDNYYYVKVRRGSVTVDSRHLLLAIGRQAEDCDGVQDFRGCQENGEDIYDGNLRKEDGVSYNLYDRADTLYTRFDTPGHPTMVSFRKDVRSLAQRAASAAERLEEIHTKQRELINGEYEGNYSAESLPYLYEMLKREEEEVVSLFCGTVNRETVYFYVEPVYRKREMFCDTVIWFSEKDGFVGDVDRHPSDAFPIVCSVVCNDALRNASRFVKYHTSGLTAARSGGRTGAAATKSRRRKTFRYRIPEQAQVSVSTPVFSVSRTLPVAQFGPVMELPCRRVKALFDANTLDLKEIVR